MLCTVYYIQVISLIFMYMNEGRPYLRPVVGYVGVLNTLWKLNPGNLKFVIKERIPYDTVMLKETFSCLALMYCKVI